MEESYEEFRDRIQRKKGKGFKKFKITNSWGVYDIFKTLRRERWFATNKMPSDSTLFYKVVRLVNKKLAEEILNGNMVSLPYHMGRLMVTKYDGAATIENGKLIIRNPISWEQTIKLWYEDEEARKAKTYLRENSTQYRYRINYNRFSAKFRFVTFYNFEVNRFIKTGLVKKIKDGSFETAW